MTVEDEEEAALRESEIAHDYFIRGVDEPRPEYVHCVQDNHAQSLGRTWCGNIDSAAFRDIDHAAMNGRNEGRLMVCRLCLRAIEKALANGWSEET